MNNGIKTLLTLAAIIAVGLIIWAVTGVYPELLWAACTWAIIAGLVVTVFVAIYHGVKKWLFGK